MQNEPENKPVVGDDGELLQADTSFPQIAYLEPQPIPLQIPIGIRIGRFIFYGIAIIVISVCSIWWISLPDNRFSNYDQYEVQSPTAEPAATQFAQHNYYFRTHPELPQKGFSILWNSYLTDIHDFSWSKEDNYLAILYGDKQIAIWDMQNNQYVTQQQSAITFDWSPTDSQTFLVGDIDSISVNHLDKQPTLQLSLNLTNHFDLPSAQVAWSAEGSYIAALSKNRTSLALFDGKNGELVTQRLFEQPILDMEWSPTDPTLLLLVQMRDLVYIQLTNADTATPLVIETENDIQWARSAFAPDGMNVALSGHSCDARLAVFESFAAAPNWVKRVFNYNNLSCTQDSITEIVWSANNAFASFTRGDDTVYLWNMVDNKVVDAFTAQRGQSVRMIAWSSDGATLTIGLNSLIIFWSP